MIAAVVVSILALAVGPAGAGDPMLCRPRGDERGALFWSCDAHDAPAPAPALEARADPLVRAAAIHAFVPRILAEGDTARADTLLAALARLPGLWGWEAVRQRARIALARADTAGADRLLEAADRAGWPDPERAGWLALRIRLRAALGDTATAVAFARQGCRRYPATPFGTDMLRSLERLLEARGETLTPEDQRAAADVDVGRSDRAAAAARLALAFARWPGEGRARVALRHGEVLRELLRFGEAHAALIGALAAAPDPGDSARVLLERARVYRDEGRPESAYLLYAEAADVSPVPAQRETATWEWARDLELAGRWREARTHYAHIADLGPRRGEEARLRAALMSLALDEPVEALGWCEQGASEGALFWRGVLLRRLGRPDGGRLLASVAARPGYSFYRSAARETLGLRSPAVLRVADDATHAQRALRAASELAGLGLANDAGQLLERWAAGDPRLSDSSGASGGAGPLLAAARIAYRAGRPRTAIGLARRALAAQADAGDSARWSVVPWAYPPAYDSLFASFPESASTAAPDRSLLQAVAWKESHFDPRARSRSDALGLLQLRRAAVSDVAGWLREPVPSDSAMLDPALSLRYGARYLERQLKRFPGNLPLALAAYNAGPSVASRWTRLRAQGGDALACEEIDFPETQDYVKTILAVRQAYRELRPTVERGR